MKLNYRTFGRLLILLAVLCPLALVLRLVTYWSELDIKTGFFLSASPSCTVFNVIGFLVFFLCLALSLSKKGRDVGKDQKDFVSEEDDSLLMRESGVYEAEEDFPEYFLHGFAKKASVWGGTFTAFAALLPGFGFISYALSFLVDAEVFSDPYRLSFALVSLCSGLFFLFYAFRNSGEKSTPFAFFALLPAFWCTFRLVIEYRDLSRFLNKSLYIGQFLFIISVLVFFLYQAQILLGEKELARPNAYVFSASAALFLGVTARLPQLIAVMGERISLDLLDSSSLLMDLAITLFVGTKLFTASKR